MLYLAVYVYNVSITAKTRTKNLALKKPRSMTCRLEICLIAASEHILHICMYNERCDERHQMPRKRRLHLIRRIVPGSTKQRLSVLKLCDLSCVLNAEHFKAVRLFCNHS